MGFLSKLLGLEADDAPAPLTVEGFPHFMRRSFPRHLKATDVAELPGGGVRVTARFKNGHHLSGDLRSQADVRQFLKRCGMIFEL